jgi:transmembrane protein TMEM174 (potassium channel)
VPYSRDKAEFDRAIAFIDGTFAVALTLLITTLDVGHAPSAFRSWSALASALGAQFVSFLIAFAVIAFAVCLDVLLDVQHAEDPDERLDLYIQRVGEFLNVDPSVPRGELGHHSVAECGLVDACTRAGLRLTHLEGRRSAGGIFLDSSRQEAR